MDVERADLGDGRIALRLAGPLRSSDAARLRHALRAQLRGSPDAVDVDLARVSALDGNAAVMLLTLRDELRARGADVRLVGAHDGVASLLALYGERTGRESLRPKPRKEGILEQIGRVTVGLWNDTHNALDYVGDWLAAFGAMLRRPASMNWPAVLVVMEQAGADALPIVLLINFLVGLVTGFQAAVQLKQVGADIFIANLVGLSVTRELGPLMTAIIVAGRSGAAFSAELGTMSVSEEIDALETLGLDPQRFLVFPRVVGLVLVSPLLVLIADAIGVLGGLVVAMTNLNLTPVAYFAQLKEAITLVDVGTGLLKSLFFGWAVATVACERGLQTRGGAAGVGRSTTSAVVASLFFLVVLDALFTVIFNYFDI